MGVPEQAAVDLVVATVGRTDELGRLLDSVARQSYRNVRMLIVDQNEDDRLVPILRRFEGRLSISRLRSSPGLSKSRNVALAHINGDVVAFPDDDCWYPPTLIEEIVRLLATHPEWAGLSVRSLDSGGRNSSMLWDRAAGPIGRFNLWRRAISFGIFLRSPAVEAVGGFSEELGQGSRTGWGSGEESEFLLRVLEAGFRIQYEPALYVNHESPRPSSNRRDRQKAYEYGRGHGYVLRLHHYPLWFVGFRVLQLMGAAAAFAVTARFALAQYYFAMALGRANGWLRGGATSPDDD
jgi:glycosyltransferase involved in cell wall biosynthesis